MAAFSVAALRNVDTATARQTIAGPAPYGSISSAEGNGDTPVVIQLGTMAGWIVPEPGSRPH
ncbi:hypothetical protein ABIA32_000467 [Streptacidiphilus sp. MAP12-20]